MKAVCKIRLDPHYRRHAFVSGLERAGYTVEPSIVRTLRRKESKA